MKLSKFPGTWRWVHCRARPLALRSPIPRYALWLCFALAAMVVLVGCGAPSQPETPAATVVTAPTGPVETVAPAVLPPRIPHDLEGRENCLMCHETGALGAPRRREDHIGRTSDMCPKCHLATVRATPTTVMVSQPPLIPHSLKGRDDCLMCHKLGIGDAPRYPDSHIGWTHDTCRGCHQPAPHPEATPPAPPHDLVGRDDCLMCHGQGIAGAPRPPDDHAGRTSDMCPACHVPSMVPTPQPTVASPLQIPHDLEGRKDCLMCHGQGTVGAPALPDDHRGRGDETCLTCHVPPTPTGETVAAVQPPDIPHTVEGRDDCLACHQTGESGAPQYPLDHEGRTDDVCQVCHAAPPPGETPSDEGPPTIPHTLEGRDDCLMCHRTGVGGAPQYPDDHAGRTSDMCPACHSPR